jgi:hypothetical protein
MKFLNVLFLIQPQRGNSISEGQRPSKHGINKY